MANIAMTPEQQSINQPSRLTLFLRYMRRNKGLALGLLILDAGRIVRE